MIRHSCRDALCTSAHSFFGPTRLVLHGQTIKPFPTGMLATIKPTAPDRHIPPVESL